MKTYGHNIPSSLQLEFSASLQLPSRIQASYSNCYNQKKYNKTKYSTNFFVKMRDPFRVPHLQGMRGFE